jgi:heat shock protein HtpX
MTILQPTITLVLLATASAAFHMPLSWTMRPTPRAPQPALFAQHPPPKAVAPELPTRAKTTAPSANGFRVPTQWILPTISYSGLATVVAGALRFIGLSWQSYALMGWTVALPVGLVVYSCSQGGAKVAESMGGRPADAQLTAYAREAAVAVGIPPPENVFQIDAREPNAFAASNLVAGSTTVAVTSGLRSALTPNELRAVLAHEMGHLQSNDVVRNMHVAVATAGFGGVYEAGRLLLDSSTKRGERSKKKESKDEGNSAGVGLMLMGAGLATQATAHMLRLSASRTAEIAADAAAARAFGADAMISALKKIDRLAARGPADLRESRAARAFAFAMISDGASGGTAMRSAQTWGTGLMTKVGNALRTHPPLDERVAALEEAKEKGLVPARSQT